MLHYIGFAMFNIRPIEEVMKEFPDFKPGWKPYQNGVMENPRFGKIRHIAVCDGKKPLWDQYQIEETPGAIIIPYDRLDGIRVGLIEIERPVIGRLSYEFPRGFAERDESETEAAYRELFQETGLKGNGIRFLEKNNPNTAFYKTEDAIFAAEFEKIEDLKKIKGDGNEKIRSVAPFKFSEIQNLQKSRLLVCGLTKAALFEFGCYEPEFYKY